MKEELNLSDWLRKYIGKHKDRESLVKAALERFPGRERAQIIRRMNDLARVGDIEALPPENRTPSRARKAAASGGKKVPKKFRMAIDVEQVKDEYDDEAKIDEGLDNLEASIIKDNDFRIELGIAQDRWKLVSSLKKFDKNKIELRGKQFKGVYWGQVEVLQELRKKIDMT